MIFSQLQTFFLGNGFRFIGHTGIGIVDALAYLKLPDHGFVRLNVVLSLVHTRTFIGMNAGVLISPELSQLRTIWSDFVHTTRLTVLADLAETPLLQDAAIIMTGVFTLICTI